MIDRDARNKAIPLLREYRKGNLAEEQLKNSWPGRTPDPALREILFRISLPATKEFKPLQIPPAERTGAVYRSILFLESNYEYRWPQEAQSARWSQFLHVLIVVLVLSAMFFYRTRHSHILIGAVAWITALLLKKRSARNKSLGDSGVWPFFSSDEYQQEQERVELQRGFGLEDYWDQVRA